MRDRPDNNVPMKEFSPLFAPFSQRMIQARHQLLHEAICHEQDSLVKPYQDGVMLIFTEQTVALLFNTLQHEHTSHPLNKLYASDLHCIQQACRIFTHPNKKPIRGFCFNQVLGQEGRLSHASTLEQLQCLLIEYGPSLISLNLSNNQLTDEESAGVMQALLSVKSPLLRKIRLSGNTLGCNTVEPLQGYLKNAVLLRELGIERCELHDEQFKMLLEKLPHIQKVNASHNHLSIQTEQFLDKQLQLPYSPALEVADWKNSCQELLSIALEGNPISDAFMHQLPSLLEARKNQALAWRDHHLFSMEGKKQMVFTAVKHGQASDVAWLEALVFMQGYGVSVSSTHALPFKKYGQEIKLMEVMRVVLRTRYVETTAQDELLKDQQQLLDDYLLKGEIHIPGTGYVKIASVPDLKQALEDRLIIYRREKLNEPIAPGEHDASLGKELIQARDELQQEIQQDVLQNYQIPALESEGDVRRVHREQQDQISDFERKKAEHQAQEAYYGRRYQELVLQKEQKAALWKMNGIQGKLPLAWNRQLTEEQAWKKHLLNHPFDPNAIEEESGDSLLHIAIRHNQLSVTALLLKAGANITVRDRQGKTVIEAAAELKDKKRRLSYLKAIVGQMEQVKLSDETDHLEPLFWLAYGEAVQAVLSTLLTSYQAYGQEMLRRQELKGLKRLLNGMTSSEAMRLARSRELSQYWKSFWTHATNGELRRLISEEKKVPEEAKFGLFGLSNSVLHKEVQKALDKLVVVLDNAPEVETNLHQAIQEQGIAGARQQEINRRCQRIPEDAKREEGLNKAEIMLAQQREADKLEANKKQAETAEQIEALKADKLETDKKLQDQDKKLQDQAKTLQDQDKKLQDQAKQFQEQLQAMREEFIKQQKEKQPIESIRGLAGKAEQEENIKEKQKHHQKTKPGKPVKVRLAPVEEASDTEAKEEKQPLLGAVATEQEVQEEQQQPPPSKPNASCFFKPPLPHNIESAPVIDQNRKPL